MSEWVLDEINALQSNYSFMQFKEFVVSHGIISTAAGVIIAYGAWDTIKSLMGDVMLPGFYFLFIYPFLGQVKNASAVFSPIQKVNFPNFVKNLISFIMMIIVTFWTIRYITIHWMAPVIKPSVDAAPSKAQVQEQATSISPSAHNASTFFLIK